MMRVLWRDLIKSGVITVSSVAGALTAAGLLTDIKSRPWRSSGTSESITITWPQPVAISCVVAPWTNCTALATMRVRGNALPGDAVPLLDTGARPACPGGGADTQWGLGANSYAFGGAAVAVSWFPLTSVRQLVIDLNDPTNPLGRFEISRLCAGAYFEPERSPDYGVSVTFDDTGESERNAAGDLVAVVGYRYTSLSLQLNTMTAGDRAAMAQMVKSNGKTVSMFVSIFPENPDGQLERDYQIYGRIVSDPATSAPSFQKYAIPLELKSV